MNPDDHDALYRAVGERIRRERERQAERVSQAELAKKLGISRASIVNIEAGRQRAPLFLLWKIALQLDVELASLIPSKSDLSTPPVDRQLSAEMRAQLRKFTNGDAELEGALSGFIAHAVIQLSGSPKQSIRAKRKKST